ncbi:MAG: glutathione S-transferase family protein [Proteobacteria bacterium]|nr:glutathione S-transferase family protein [Pseudomonadota bacterium]
MILYANEVSNFCAKVRIVLALKCVDAEERPPPDGYGSARFKAVAPLGTIPALVDGDLVLHESDVINEYLDERYPAPPLLPGDAAGRARIRLLTRFHDSHLEPPLRRLFAQMDPRRRDAAVAARGFADYQAQLARLAALGRFAPYLAGDRLTLADCAYPATLMLGDLMAAQTGIAVAKPAAVADWQARLAAEPGIAPALARARAGTLAWLAEQRRGPTDAAR